MCRVFSFKASKIHQKIFQGKEKSIANLHNNKSGLSDMENLYETLGNSSVKVSKKINNKKGNLHCYPQDLLNHQAY